MLVSFAYFLSISPLFAADSDESTTLQPIPYNDIVRPASDEYPDLLEIGYRKCFIEEWNKVYTEAVEEPLRNEEEEAINDAYLVSAPSVFSAFAFNSYIEIQLINESWRGKNVTCHYFDCHRTEISPDFSSRVGENSTVKCARRIGAEYVTVSRSYTPFDQNNVVPIVNRVTPGLKHYLTGCVFLNQNRRRFADIVELLERHKEQGFSFFHIYVLNITDYDRVAIDDYMRTGEANIIKLQANIEGTVESWKHVYRQDCVLRNKNFTHFTAFLKLKNFMEIANSEFGTVSDYLERLWPSAPGRIQIGYQTVKDKSPILEEFNSTMFSQIESRQKNLTNLEAPTESPKFSEGFTIFQPNSDENLVAMDRNIVIRKYGAIPLMKINITAPNYDRKLPKEFFTRLRYIYDIKPVTCDQKQYVYWFHGQDADCWTDLVERGIINKYAPAVSVRPTDPIPGILTAPI
ncbi:unnamed protein product [Caenorhabditis bovis]|uniref:Glycosyltransferase family 92 protein n=1 Tax=Caenorhabditis bovis TaxID=2654633 RepID=A0A8S1ELL9_9PELO|nr:unnamed protein product [Caenorhabditis bovis]